MGKRHLSLLVWQRCGYAINHRNPINLVLHLITMPLFVVAAILPLGGLFSLDLLQVVLGATGIGAGLAVQAKGHASEEQAPEPSSDRRDAVSRLLVEQLVTFLRLALSGAWQRAWCERHKRQLVRDSAQPFSFSATLPI